MPYTVDEQPSAAGDLIQAAAYGLGAAAFVPAVWKVAGMFGKAAWRGAIKPAAKIAGVGVGVAAAAPLGAAYLGIATAPGRKVSGFLAKRVAQTGYQVGRTVVGGAGYGTFKAASWVYNHPGMSIGLAGAAGVGVAGMSSNVPNARMYSGGMVEIMGGSSSYGVSQMMANMNASGNIVLGANNRRR